jgi:raffinose/stachyose/melibiose transport system substrate-binding protein
MKKKVISMFLTACTVSVMVVGGGSNLVMADDAETVTLMGWYDEDDMNPILEKVNEQMDGKYVIEYTYVANTDYNNVLSTQLASGEGPDIIMDGTNYPAEIKAGNVEDISDYDFVKRSIVWLEEREGDYLFHP